MNLIFIIILLLFSCDSSEKIKWNNNALNDIVFENNNQLILIDFYTDW